MESAIVRGDSVGVMRSNGRDRIVPYLGRLYRYAWVLTRIDDAAQDLVQDAACKALSARRVPTDEPAYRSWLFKVVRNQHIDNLRRQRIIERHIDDVDEAEQGEMEYWRGDDRLINRISVRKALAKLPPQQAEILVLVDISGLTYRETAGVFDIPVGTVMSRLSRARSALLEKLVAEADSAAHMPQRRKN